MWPKRELRAVTRQAEMTGPESVVSMPVAIRHADVLALIAAVHDANNRLVMATAAKDRAEIAYTQARNALALKMKEYGLLSLVDGKEPPTPEDE